MARDVFQAFPCERRRIISGVMHATRAWEARSPDCTRKMRPPPAMKRVPAAIHPLPEHTAWCKTLPATAHGRFR